LERGFKSQCERRAAEIRTRLSLDPSDPINWQPIANLLNSTVWGADNFADLGENDKNLLFAKDKDSWSAFTLKEAGRSLVVYNPSQTSGRLNSVIMHELAHIMLGHKLVSISQDLTGNLIVGSFNKDDEDEANWLSGTLLLPRPALFKMYKNKISPQTMQEIYQVSPDMLTWRVRMTGIAYQFR
jgi:Zn-dependent peptidase ImmA (M78 family)